MMVPPKHPKMITFSRENPWLLGTTILGNPYMRSIWFNISTRGSAPNLLFRRPLWRWRHQALVHSLSVTMTPPDAGNDWRSLLLSGNVINHQRASKQSLSTKVWWPPTWKICKVTQFGMSNLSNSNLSWSCLAPQLLNQPHWSLGWCLGNPRKHSLVSNGDLVQQFFSTPSDDLNHLDWIREVQTSTSLRRLIGI